MDKEIHTDLVDKDLGIEKDLNEGSNHLARQKLQILFPFILAIGVISYMVYSTFFNKELEKKEEKKEVTIVESKKFEAPPVITQIVQKIKTELPMSPNEPIKPKYVPRVSKSSKGTIISFNEPPEKVVSSQNQLDINIMNNSLGLNNQTKITPQAPTEKKVQIYTGGDYAIAGISRQDPNLSLAKGSYIECTMVTRIVSSYSGNTKCITSEDIYSTNGVTLLMEKGSTVTGHFKGGSMENGIERLFVIWDEIRTPNNVVINIDSQATGELGATGVDGYVDNHWGMRFGAAILVSILDIGSEALKNKYSGGDNSNTNYGSNNNAVKSMSNTALNQFINIKPTFYKNHGDVVGIYIEKDLDFSKVYRLK
jgi:type IV secretion system protein VirB10